MSPTYRNCSKTRKNLNGKVLEPGEEIASLIYFDDIDLKKTQEYPFYNPIILSAKIEKDTEIKIPERDDWKNWISKYSIHFHVQKGEVVVSYNSKGNIPGLHLYEGCSWNERTFDRKIDKLIVSGTEGFILWIIVERLQ